MNTKIQELTDIIYNEGVAKGQAEADQILAQAKEQAQKLIADARKEADALLASAKKESADNAENVRKELKLYAAQAVEALKSEIASVVTDKIVKDAVKGFTSDQKAFNEFILTIAKEWGKNQQIEIKTTDADSLTKFFQANAARMTNARLQLINAGQKYISEHWT